LQQLMHYNSPVFQKSVCPITVIAQYVSQLNVEYFVDKLPTIFVNNQVMNYCMNESMMNCSVLTIATNPAGANLADEPKLHVPLGFRNVDIEKFVLLFDRSV